MGYFLGELRMEWVEKKQKWKLLNGLSYVRDDGIQIVAPIGMLTDLDSVPRLPLVYWMVKGRALKAAIIHDALYWYGVPREGADPINRRFADETMFEAMKAEGVGYLWRVLIYRGLRIGSLPVWNRYRRTHGEMEDDT